MADHDTHDHTGVPGVGTTVADILDLSTAETDDTLVLAPDGAGGVEFRAEAGGGGGGTQAYLGYNSVGASWQTMSGTLYMRKITVPTGGGFLMGVEGHIKGLNDGGVSEYAAVVYDDSAGAPTNVRGYFTYHAADQLYQGTTARWMSFSVGQPFLAAGDYWIGVGAGGSTALAYDTGGSTADNKTTTIGNGWFTDAAQGATFTGVTNQHSVRANMLYI